MCAFYDKQINLKKYERKFGSVQVLLVGDCILFALHLEQYLERGVSSWQLISVTRGSKLGEFDSKQFLDVQTFTGKALFASASAGTRTLDTGNIGRNSSSASTCWIISPRAR